jgi:hypothetical protein
MVRLPRPLARLTLLLLAVAAAAATLNGSRQQIGVLPVQPGGEITVSFTAGR